MNSHYSSAEFAPLSQASLKKLMKGQAVRVKHGSGLKLHLSKVQQKKHKSTKMKGKGYNLTFDPYQMELHGRGLTGKRGQGFLDDLEAFSVQALPALTNAGKALLDLAPKTPLNEYLINEYTVEKPMKGKGNIMEDFGDAAGKFIGNTLRDLNLGQEKDPLAFLYGGRLNAHSQMCGCGVMDMVKKLAPHAKKALIAVGKEAGKQLLSKGLDYAQQKALEHGVPPEKIHQSKQIAHALAQGQPVNAEQMVREVVEGTLQKHPHYEKVQALMRQMFGHGLGSRGRGGTLLIDEPFTVRQAGELGKRLVENPLGTLGFGVKKRGRPPKKAPKKGGALLDFIPKEVQDLGMSRLKQYENMVPQQAREMGMEKLKQMGMGVKKRGRPPKKAPKKGGTLLIDEPITARQIVNTAGDFLKNPASALGFGMKYKKGGALLQAGY